jgi:K+-sensing histidine kinase KdpD
MQRPAVRFDVLALRSAKSRNAYGVALLAVGVALACTYLSVALAERSQLFLLLAAVVVGAWCGGLGPGLAATAVSIVGHLAFVKAPYG